MRAAFFGDVAVIQSMVAAGVDEHGTDLLDSYVDPCYPRKRTVDGAFARAVVRGHLDAVELLLGAGADAHAENVVPLYWACYTGRADMVSLLIQYGAE